MPEIRYAQVFQKGVLTGVEPYEVSDEALAEEKRHAARARLRKEPQATWDNAPWGKLIRDTLVSQGVLDP